MSSDRFSDTLERIDRANAADPDLSLDGGKSHPAALIYGWRMSAELVRFCSDASEHLRVAARGQHIERWKLRRDTYPEGREGYLTWRRDQGRFHAQRVAELMGQAGYGQADCERVGTLIRKEGIKRDAEVQALEDVACLVFLRWYALDFAAGHDPEKVARIVAKTARKMSEAGRAFTVNLGLPDGVAAAFKL